ncbi:hypothetical protein SAMN05192549_10271 [Duganella sacchari]|uniref:Uncharacterized protein n=1 Tax=Duganella sacchari TaxID=551987 RepID=A0A1M7KET1_9BURK|nr:MULTISPECIES: hypothetical protein [Duganella]MYM28468.1 hypothetical protein [Duganella sp. CY15W]SHM63713.1 hypothetical protein SAMN05192549_10271 [Duganella sacchari]
MGAVFWIKRYLQAAVPLFAILAAVEWIKGSTAREDYLSAGAWALIAAGIFTYFAWRRYRNAVACGMCDNFAAASKNDKPS